MDQTILAERNAAADALMKESALAIAKNLGLDAPDFTVPTGDTPPEVVTLFAKERVASFYSEIADATAPKAPAKPAEPAPTRRPDK